MLILHDIFMIVNDLNNINMPSIHFTTKQKLSRYVLYAAMATTISSGVFILSLPVGMALAVQYIDPAKLSKLIPKSMQFLAINGPKHMTPQINAMFYIGLIFAAIITAATIYLLYKMHTKSREIAIYEFREEAFHATKGQTVSYHKADDAHDYTHYVMLNKEYAPGCIMISKSGAKIAILGHPEVVEHVEKNAQQEPKKDYMYPVIAYYHKKKLTSQTETGQTNTDREVIIGLDGFSTDFFKKGTISRSGVTILEHNPGKLVDLFIEPYSQTKAPDTKNS